MTEALFHIGLLIVVAKLAEGVLGRFGVSSIIAYTITGVVIGPVIGLVDPSAELNVFLGVGVFVFFFLIGIDEIDIQGFLATIRGRFFVAAILSVAISLVASLAVTSDILGLEAALNLDFDHAMALAGVLSLSSLGLVTKVLADGGHLRQPVGLEIFTTVIIAELIALLVVGFTIGEHEHEVSIAGVLLLLGQIAGFAVAAWLLSSRILPPIIVRLQRLLRTPQLSFGLLLGGLFLMVVGAEEIGLHGTIGALLFGAALSGIPHQVREDVMPGMRSTAEGLFIPLFFASAGLHMDLSFINLPATTILMLVALPLAGKFAGAFIGTFAARLDNPLALATGLMAKGVAEIALLLLLLEFGVIDQAVFSLLVLIMFGYILLMPTAINLAVKGVKIPIDLTLPDVVPPSFARVALDGITAGAFLDPSRQYPTSDVTVREFSRDWVIPNHHDYIVMDSGEVKGIVSLTRLRFVRRSRWRTTVLGDVLRLNPPWAYPDEPIDDVLERMVTHNLTIIPCKDRKTGEFVGSIANFDVLDLVKVMYQASHEMDANAQAT